MAKFTLSAHAQTVIAERGIHLDWIERVLTNPERVEQGKNVYFDRTLRGKL